MDFADEYSSVFRVMFNFEAKSEPELDVNDGDVVVANAPPQDSWVFVNKVDDVQMKGFVPFEFLEEMSPAEASSYLPSPIKASPSKQESIFTPAIREERSPKPHVSFSSSRTSTVQLPPAVPREEVVGQSISEAYAKHEQYFKQVTRQREDTFRKLEESIGGTAKEIRECQRKNQDLAAKIRELDSLVEDERKKWKERLNAEKKTFATHGSVRS